MFRFLTPTKFAALILFTRAAVQVTSAQQPGGQQPDGTIDAATRTQVIESISKRLNEAYVFPEVAKKMETSLHERVAKKEYDQITSSTKFAETLTKDLQVVSNDKHLRVRYSHEPLPVRPSGPAEPTAEEREEERRAVLQRTLDEMQQWIDSCAK